ncbi:MAG TPA: hypothetical protein VFW11_08640 [Cyclobacteriaceae bacterium]|nr:hypothetical protein [Cyclobacteriaceae bacterium]
MNTSSITTTRTSVVQQVCMVLKYTYGLVPIVAGLDKFTNLLTDWTDYLSPGISSMLPMSPSVFMMVVGVIEIIAGVLVLAKPHFGAWIVMAWLLLISLTLIAGGHYLDVAVRDIVMAIGAFALAKLSSAGVEVK